MDEKEIQQAVTERMALRRPPLARRYWPSCKTLMSIAVAASTLAFMASLFALLV